MNKLTHLTAVQKGVFLLIGSGESYNTEIVKGSDLVEKILGLTCGDPKEASDEERAYWASRIDDPDCWNHNPDLGPQEFSEDVGETDQIRVFLIEGLKDLPTVPIGTK